MMSKVLPNDFARQWSEIGADVLAAVERVGQGARYILGPEVARFESALAEYWGFKHAIGVGNGLDALEIALRSLGMEPGAKVLTTPISAFATTLAILRAGGIPVFVDVDANGLLNLDQCREVLKRDRGVRFMMPVHLYGIPINLHALAELRDEFELLLVEDCAQSIGATYDGGPTGKVGQMTTTSFYPTKNLGALGDGGAILTNDPELADEARVLRNTGRTEHHLHTHLGLNSRLDELHAVILSDALLPRLSRWTEIRRTIARRYLTGIRHPGIRLPHVPAQAEPSWHLFPTFTSPERRDSFRKHLEAAGIFTSIHYPTAIPDQPALTAAGRHEVGVEPQNARQLVRSETSIPIHPFLNDDEVEQVMAACNSWPA